MNRFRKKFTRGCALLLAVVMLLFTPATDYLSVGQDITGKIESEAFVAGVAAYEIIKYLLIAAASLAGAYGLSNVQWGNLVNEFLDSINDTALSINAFTQIIIKEGETISKWGGSAFYFPNGLGGDPNNPDPNNKPRISLARKLTVAWLLFLNSKNLTSSSRQPDATVAEVTEYVPEAVFSDDYVIKLGTKTQSDILSGSSQAFQNAVKNSSYIYPKFFDDSLTRLYAYKTVNINVEVIESLMAQKGILSQYPYWVVFSRTLYCSSLPLITSGDLIYIEEKNSNIPFIKYDLTPLLLWGKLSPAYGTDYSLSLNSVNMTNTSISLPNGCNDFGFVGFHVNDLAKCKLENPAFYIDLSSKMFKFANKGGTNDPLSKLSFYGYDFGSSAYVSHISNYLDMELSFVSDPKLAYTYTFPFYSTLYDYKQDNPTVTAPASGLYDPTKSTENVLYDEEGNFSLEFDDLKQSMDQLNQKVDAATEADTALDNQLKQELMDYVDSLTQGKTEPEVPPETDPAPTETAPPETDPAPTEPPPETDPSTDPTPDDLKPENWKIPLEFKNKFPFSIPWDVYGALTVLQATETPPIWEVPFVVKNDYIKIEEKIVLDLTKPEYANLIKIIRTFFLLIYIVSLVMVTRYLIKG